MTATDARLRGVRVCDGPGEGGGDALCCLVRCFPDAISRGGESETEYLLCLTNWRSVVAEKDADALNSENVEVGVLDMLSDDEWA